MIAKNFIQLAIIKVFLIFNKISFSGFTLVLMHSSKEPNSFFGGMAAPS